MIEFLQHVLAFIFALALLITFHEFGHFWVARRCDVKILRFSIGFGNPLFLRKFGPDDTEFVIASVPLGGYVKMLDEREGPVPENEKHRAFNGKPLGQRFAIVFAGPAFNFIFAIIAYWLVFVIGISGYKPIIDEVEKDSIAYQSGFEAGQEILEVDGKRTLTWASTLDRTVSRVIDADQINFRVREKSYLEREITLDVSSISVDDIAGGQLLEQLGIKPKGMSVPAKIKRVQVNSPAETAGIQAGDEIIRADGTEIREWDKWVKYVRTHPEQDIKVVVLRDGNMVDLVVRPRRDVEEGEAIGKVGVEVDFPTEIDPDLLATESYGPVEAVWKSLEKIFEVSVMSLSVLGKMIIGEVSVKNLSGPLSIAQYAGYTAAAGVAVYISFLALVSVSLGLLNLFPIPLLDGGHLMYYLIEFVKGSPVSESAQLIGQQVGLAVLLGLMTLVFYNDIMRLIG